MKEEHEASISSVCAAGVEKLIGRDVVDYQYFPKNNQLSCIIDVSEGRFDTFQAKQSLEHPIFGFDYAVISSEKSLEKGQLRCVVSGCEKYHRFYQDMEMRKNQSGVGQRVLWKGIKTFGVILIFIFVYALITSKETALELTNAWQATMGDPPVLDPSLWFRLEAAIGIFVRILNT